MASIEKRGQNSWRLVVEAGYDSRGKRVKRTKTIKIDDKALLRTTKKLRDYLDDELHKFKIEVAAGEYTTPQKMTLEQFVTGLWVPKYASKTDNLSPLTFKNYMTHINVHILPALGHKRLDEISTIHLINFFDTLGKTPISAGESTKTLANATINYTRRVINNILMRATDWQILKYNPTVNTKNLKARQTIFGFYDSEDAEVLIRLLQQEDAKWRLLILGAMVGGLRRGELIAMEWSDINYVDNTISVSKSISLTAASKAIEKKPKSKSSERIIDMPAWYMQDLKRYEIKWIKEKLLVGEKWNGGSRSYIFHGGFGRPYYYTVPTAWWQRFLSRHGLKKIRFHDLRHSSATLLIEAGAPLKAIQTRLGHAKHQTTADIYAHVTTKVSRETADKFDRFNPENLRPQSVPKAKI